MSDNVAFIFAHPDDELFSCPGYLSSVALDPNITTTLIFCFEGSSARFSLSDLRSEECLSDIELRRSLSLSLSEYLGIDRTLFLDLRNLRHDLSSCLDISKLIRNCFDQDQFPSTVITHSDLDLNLDHRLVSLSTQAAFRPVSKEPPNIFFADVLSSSEWSSLSHAESLFKDITPFIPQIEFLYSLYDSECRPVPHPRNLETYLARARINGSKSGLLYADAFFPYRFML